MKSSLSTDTRWVIALTLVGLLCTIAFAIAFALDPQLRFSWGALLLWCIGVLANGFFFVKAIQRRNLAGAVQVAIKHRASI